MSETIYLTDQRMFRDVYTLNSPHGPIIVWESLYPGDKGCRDRYVVTLNERFNRRVIEWFSTCGFFSDAAMSKSEAIKEADSLFAVSAATAHARCKTDPILKKKRLAQWERASAKYR